MSAQELLQSQRPATPILLVFWATWCPECIPDLFTLAQNRNRLPMDLTILSVNIEPGSSSEAFRQTKTMLSDSMVFATLQGESAPLSDEWLSGQEIIMPTLLYFPRA
ncbi:MAG: redoxin domain-containing protein, partial [Leptospiraceae bacterium]|nr:redoxin domain-containing protein [Leptospiraceae bacterium]